MKQVLLFVALFSVFLLSSALGQKKAADKKYPSLFWEISGNGLKKPSYLFGTMHVSSKMVFHLSDSFYYAMRNTEAVALELNPEIWQDEMFRLQKAQLNLARFSFGKMNDYLRESSFKLNKYEDDIKRALTEEPTVVNNLLYRSYQSTADFEENTYLDLYIFQTGRKLGKRPAGVENYLESERLMMEAYQDMAKDKGRKRMDTDGESFYEIQKKIQQAYRNGDLDLMDSLQAMTSTSPAFSEKFLYLRNEIQANSIDTIVKKHSLFVGVGAAHLPGQRGVIELLRKKGYHLRPIFMQDRDASQKDEIDKLKVPVVFNQETTSDGQIQLQLPGKFYKREEVRVNESWQYADMNNGSYYMLTRVKTHATMLGHDENMVFGKVDSMLYENIPGKILKKTRINKNGFSGYDITNRTRRGDLQKYEILVTPYEVLVFKMSGNDAYVDGKEADIFFNSIKIQPLANGNVGEYSPKQGGFTARFTNEVNESYIKNTLDGGDRWNYESYDKSTGNAYMIWKKSLYNFNFIDEDTFDLALINESFKSSDFIYSQLSKRQGIQNKMRFLESQYLLKDGNYLTSRTYIKGPHYYLLAARSKNKKADFSEFFNSFRFTGYNYNLASNYVDSALHLQVFTPVKPNVDTILRSWMEKANLNATNRSSGNSTAWPKNKTGIFKSDSTGECILVTVQTFPRYYYSPDSASFWKDKLDEQEVKKEFIISKKQFFKLKDSACGYNLVLTDTNSSRCIKIAYFLKGNNLFKFSTLSDTTDTESDFIQKFYATARPVNQNAGSSVFKNKTEQFFADYFSKDSLTHKQAIQAIQSIYFKKADITRLVAIINSLKYGDKDYFDIKSKLINEIGYIDDSSGKGTIVSILKDLYNRTADTAYFQNPVLSALARLKTKESYVLLKDLLLQDPPVFDDAYEYERIFGQFNDSLKLSKELFPGILQLASLEDYKPHVNRLLKLMVDSGYLKQNDYKDYFSKLYFDAKIELKKHQNRAEKLLEIESDDNEKDNGDGEYKLYYNNLQNPSLTGLKDFAVLLMPFYEKHNSVPIYFEKLLQSKDADVQLIAAEVLLQNNRKVPDSLLASIASKDGYRAKLLVLLEDIEKKELFPSTYKNQQLLAKAILLNNKNYKEFSAIQLVEERLIEINGIRGRVYLFKYKIRKDDDWKMGISGLQPVNIKEVNSNDMFVKLTDRKLRSNTTELSQFDEQIKKLIFTRHKSARMFFNNSGLWDYSDGNIEE